MTSLMKTSVVWIAVISVVGVFNANLVADTMFFDDFEYGDPLDVPGECPSFDACWDTWNGGGSYFVGPVDDPDPDYPGDQALLVDDYLTSGAGATSKQTFEYANQLTYFSADLKDGHASSATQRYTYFSLVKSNQSTGASDQVIASIITRPSDHSPTPNGIDCALVWDDNGTEEREASGILYKEGFLGEVWHTATFAIRADGIVDFLINGDAVYTSTHPIIPDYSGQAAIELGMRKSYYDNVLVTPEPATLSLLALGGLALLRRRRRISAEC